MKSETYYRWAAILVIAVFGMLMSGCAPSYKGETGEYKLPEELSDCKIFLLKDGSGSNLTITRCPNSSTTSSRTKISPTTVVDGDSNK